MGRLWPYRTGAMQNVVYELRRIYLPRTWVNKGKKEGRGARPRPFLVVGREYAASSVLKAADALEGRYSGGSTSSQLAATMSLASAITWSPPLPHLTVSGVRAVSWNAASM